MGFLDNVLKVVRVASDIASEIENVTGKASEHGKEMGSTESSIAPAKPAVWYKNTFFDEDDVEVEYSFEISGDFIEADSHAAEVDTLFTYEPSIDSPEKLGEPDLEKPYIFTSMGDGRVYELVKQFKETGNVKGLIKKCDGKMLFKCKTDYYGRMMVLYGMDRGRMWENCGIALTYKKNIEGTALEEKLIAILDKAAETYSERNL